MDQSLILYNLALGLGCAALPPLWLGARLGRRYAEVWPRLGLYRHTPEPGPGPRVWLQAVSVGEVAVARAVAERLWELRPDVKLIVSSSTAKGLERAAELFAGRALVAPFPLDMPWAAAAAVARLRPQVYASLETEIWPNLLALLRRSGAGVLLLNGRFSERSFPGYRRFRWLIAPALARFDHLSMIGPADAQRAVALGAPAARVSVDGNAKYAGLLERAQASDPAEAAALLKLDGAPLLVAGSMRGGEEAVVMEAFAKVRARFPRAVLAVAPRHLERGRAWLRAAAAAGLTAQSWTHLRPDAPRRPETAVVVVDVMGRLMAIYGLGAAAVVGASFVGLGGQNPMEPAAWGKPVAFGPDMSDFADASQALIEAGGGRQAADGAALGDFWLAALADPALALAWGRAGQGVVERWSRAAEAAAGHIVRRLDRRGARA